jgi:hypothetical protein
MMNDGNLKTKIVVNNESIWWWWHLINTFNWNNWQIIEIWCWN